LLIIWTKFTKRVLNFAVRRKGFTTQNLAEGERTRLADQNVELLNWFGRQLLVAREKFAPHLKLDR